MVQWGTIGYPRHAYLCVKWQIFHAREQASKRSIAGNLAWARLCRLHFKRILKVLKSTHHGNGGNFPVRNVGWEYLHRRGSTSSQSNLFLDPNFSRGGRVFMPPVKQIHYFIYLQQTDVCVLQAVKPNFLSPREEGVRGKCPVEVDLCLLFCYDKSEWNKKTRVRR